jgi:hypothetical protein
MILMRANPFRGPEEGVGPENRDFFGPLNGTSEASAIWAIVPLYALVIIL